MKKTLITLALSLTSLVGPLAWNANAQVVVNGYLMQGEDLMLLQYLVGSPIPAGYYWLDENGNWGYEGSSVVQGNILYGTQSTNSGGSGNIYDGEASYIESDNGCAYFSSDAGSISSCN
ncbi:hypothetical protein IQ254_07400 [Nodosilinea sp. LEGE 07088]|uniref:hypothetical protein n=1 Tax=Nodosilinea sp. LEGE 07088 TaxID=2777968 RepID=UPI001881C7EF|nr:hypothetical protein [Nodosilinea sp. LEGE 07088]MBE9137028.1 hypothetical protein [Nodosilinea sp. LEGE 07088]